MVQDVLQAVAAGRARSYSARFILNTALWLTALGIVVRACGALKEIIFARAYGVSADTDAFVLALTYATFLPSILGSALATALIAALAKAAASSTQSGLSALTRWIVAVALLCALVTYVFPGLILPAAFNAGPDTLERAVAYSKMLAPLSFAIVVSSAMAALLNSNKQFYVPAAAALATPVAMMITIVFMSRQWGVAAAIQGMVVGGVLEVFILALRIHFQRGTILTVRTGRQGMEIAFLKSVAILTVAATVAALFPVVDQVFLSRLATGAVTHFNYASKVNSLLIGVFGTAFSVAIYPYLSDLAAQRDRAGLKRLTWRLASVVLPIIALASLMVFVFSYDIVRLLFQRGNFTAASVAEVGLIQRVFALQLVFYVAGLLAVRVLNATNAARSVLVVSCIGLASTWVFDWMFYGSMGASGIALSAVLTSAINFAAAMVLVRIALHHTR